MFLSFFENYTTCIKHRGQEQCNIISTEAESIREAVAFKISAEALAPYGTKELTHWGRATHICVSELTIIGSDNGLSPERPQAII